jgi:hypothetical protein
MVWAKAISYKIMFTTSKSMSLCSHCICAWRYSERQGPGLDGLGWHCVTRPPCRRTRAHTRMHAPANTNSHQQTVPLTPTDGDKQGAGRIQPEKERHGRGRKRCKKERNITGEGGERQRIQTQQAGEREADVGNHIEGRDPEGRRDGEIEGSKWCREERRWMEKGGEKRGRAGRRASRQKVCTWRTERGIETEGTYREGAGWAG